MQIRTGASVKLSILGLLWMLLLAPQASGRTEAPALGGVGVWEGRERHPELTEALILAARAQGEPLRWAAVFADAACVQYECLSRLARRHGLAWIVGGQLRPRRSADDDVRKLHLFVFDAQRNGPIGSDLYGRIDDLARALPQALATLLQESAAPLESPRLPTLVSGGPVATRPGERTGRGLRIVLASGLGVLATLSLTGAIVAHVLHNQPAAGAICDDAPALMRAHDTACLYQTTPLFASGYSIAAASLVGVALSLGIP